MKRLPDSEFIIMDSIWGYGQPVTANIIMDLLGTEKRWKVQTAITLLNRLVERGFLSTDKTGRERTYIVLVGKEDYLKFETDRFMNQYHGNSVTSFMNALMHTRKFSDKDVEDLIQFIDQQGK